MPRFADRFAKQSSEDKCGWSKTALRSKVLNGLKGGRIWEQQSQGFRRFNMKEININEIDGFKIGNAQDYDAMTGVTVILCEKGGYCPASI